MLKRRKGTCKIKKKGVTKKGKKCREKRKTANQKEKVKKKKVA